MRFLLCVTLAFLSLAGFAEDGDSGGKHGGTGVHSLGKVGGFDYLQADEVALPDMDFGKGPTGPNSYSVRKNAKSGDPNAFLFSDGKTQDSSAKNGDAGGADKKDGGSDQDKLNGLDWKQSSYALVKDANGNYTPQMLQFGYDTNGQIAGVKFGDGSMKLASIPNAVPMQLRTVNGGFNGNIAGKSVKSLESESQRGAG